MYMVPSCICRPVTRSETHLLAAYILYFLKKKTSYKKKKGRLVDFVSLICDHLEWNHGIVAGAGIFCLSTVLVLVTTRAQPTIGRVSPVLQSFVLVARRRRRTSELVPRAPRQSARHRRVYWISLDFTGQLHCLVLLRRL